MNNKKLNEIDYTTKEKIEGLVNKRGLQLDELLNRLIEENRDYKEKMSKVIEENKILKQRELDILEVGDSLSDGIYCTDKNGIVVSVNKTYTQITGIQPEEIMGRNIQAVLDEKYASGEYVIVRLEQFNKEKGKDTLEHEEECVTKKPMALGSMVLNQKKCISYIATLSVKGSKKKMIFTGKPYFDGEGNVTHVLTVIRETTEFAKLKKKLEEAERKSKKYLNELMFLRVNQTESDLIGRDPSIEQVKALIMYVAKTEATVLITGETGVGKEVVAREIHKKSNRSNKPYIKVNCAAIPDSLLESELFGYEKGAFTGANNKEKLGYFEIANGGTILLDEIGEMPVKLQSKLLRVLQEREITRIGGTKPIALDIRVIAATNQNIEGQIKKGTFREDLYYRLNVVPIEIPPLRERKADITLLAYKFLEEYNEKYNKNKEFEISALEALESYEWTGNVRELENTIERLVIIGDDEAITESNIFEVLGKEKFPYDIIHNEGITLKDAVDRLERNIIEKVLKKYKSSRKAAKVLGVTQPTVLRKAKALGIEEW